MDEQIAVAILVGYLSQYRSEEAFRMFTVATVCANVLIYGVLGWAVVGWLSHRSHARVAGVFLAVGFAVGSFGGHAAQNPRTSSNSVPLVQLWD